MGSFPFTEKGIEYFENVHYFAVSWKKEYAQSSYARQRKKGKKKQSVLKAPRNIFSDTLTLQAHPHTSHSASRKPHCRDPPDLNHGSTPMCYHVEGLEEEGQIDSRCPTSRQYHRREKLELHRRWCLAGVKGGIVWRGTWT